MDIKMQIVNALRESNINFNALCEEEHEEVEDYLTEKIKDVRLSFDSGLSKLVIFMENDPYVIKIPFTRMFDEQSYDSDLSYWDTGDLDQEPERGNYYQNFDSATSAEVETADSWDYCALECAFYEKAYERGLAQYFAREELYAMVLDYPIYIQEKVTPLEATSYTIDNNKLKTTRDRCSKLNVRCFCTQWITDFFDVYGEEEFIKLSNFLDEMKIYDLHEGNLGYHHGIPVLLDYSDFREW